MKLKYFKNLIAAITILGSCTAVTAGLDDYHDADTFDKYNPLPSDFNTNSSQVGYDSQGNDDENALQFSGGAEIWKKTPLYDNYGKPLEKDGDRVWARVGPVGYYDGKHYGKIHAGAIAEIKINGNQRTCVYVNAVDLQRGNDTHSGWIRIDRMKPESTIESYQNSINDRRESSSVRYTSNSLNWKYKKHKVIDTDLPSKFSTAYIIPNRTSDSGKAEYYYIRDGVLNGFINLPETGNGRHGVAASRVRPGKKFYVDSSVPAYEQILYKYNSSSKAGSFDFVFGYFLTNKGTKIYCWTNSDCLEKM